ncbi:MAG: YabP/YqfC family sporulation protein [Clostridia bacterium]|nr:YabP/YqfC family sporulation protein [Clostridia bacterium]
MAMRVKKQLEHWLDLPKGSLTGESRLEIYAGRMAVMDGRCAVLTCEEDVVRLRTAGGVLCFRGRELRLSAFSANGATVEGRLCAVEFE